MANNTITCTVGQAVGEDEVEIGPVIDFKNPCKISKKSNAVNSVGILKPFKYLSLLSLLILSKSHCLTLSYTTESVKKNSTNLGNLDSRYGHRAPLDDGNFEARHKLSIQVLTTKYSGILNHGETNPSLNLLSGVNEDPDYSDGNLKLKGENNSLNLVSGGIKLRHWSKVVAGVVILTSTFALLMMTIIRIIESKIEDTQDSFLKNAYNMCYKQIALIGVINLVLWLILQTKLAKKLDRMIFYRDANLSPLNGDVNPIVEPVFECLLSVCVILLAWYIVYVIYFQFIVRRITTWMRKTDNCDVLTIASDLQVLEGNWCYFLWSRNTFNRGNFLANRFEFIDNINNASLPKIDPGGYYFMEYLRANILDYSVQMLKVPREVLVFVIALSLILRKTFDFEGKNEVMLISIFSLFCVVSLVILAYYVFLIETKLYPSNLTTYLMLKHNTDDLEISKYSLKSLLPPYKLDNSECEVTNCLVRFVHGDGPVNKHENLFIFKSKGPKILAKLFENLCFGFLLVLSICVYLIKQHADTWLKHYRFGICVIFLSIIIVGFLTPKILYSLIIVSKTGLLIDFDTVEKVWESNRSNNTRHALEIIDALNLDYVMNSLNTKGETYWRHLVGKLKTSPLAVQEQMSEVWRSLDGKKKGYIGMEKILRYISSQGLQFANNKKIKEFIRAFTRTEPHRLNEDEFSVLGLVVKQIIVVPLDISQMKALFEDAYKIPWNSPGAIDSSTLQTIIKRLGLKWNEGDRRHLLDFLSGGRCDGMSAEKFINQLSTVEQLIKANNYNGLYIEI